MRNYKTAISGFFSAFTSFILFSSQLHMVEWPQWVLAVGLFAHVGGLAAFGVYARDAKDSDKRD